MSSASPPQTLTVLEALRRSTDHLEARGVEPARLDAELLLSHALGLTRLQLYLEFERPLTDGERDRARALLARRSRREPIAHITGEREFHSLAFEVTPDVLVPRPETELIVDTLLALDREGRLPPGDLVDIGTGSGCVGVTLAHHLPERSVTATDISAAALTVARRNAARHGVSDRVTFAEGDLAAGCAGPFAAVVSNPPYVAERERASLAPEVLAEPEVALFAGEDGFAVVRRLVEATPGLLVSGGWLLTEIGHGQAERVRAMVRGTEAFEDIDTLRDLAGIDRVIAARRS